MQSRQSYIGFFFSRPNWDPPPTPSPAGECVPSPFGSWGDTLGGGWVPIWTRGQTLWYCRYTVYLFCGPTLEDVASLYCSVSFYDPKFSNDSPFKPEVW